MKRHVLLCDDANRKSLPALQPARDQKRGSELAAHDHKDKRTRVTAAKPAGPQVQAEEVEQPVMMDIMSGPHAPVTRACQWCGWAAVPPIDIKIDPGMDIDSKPVQDAIRQELASVHFVMMAIECSTKSRAREIPIAGAKRPPRQLRSVECPMGLPGLTPQEQQRVDKDNRVCRFLLELAAEAPALGQANVRENPLNSYHWLDPAEVEMQESGAWQDTIYDACVFAGARKP